MAARGTNGRVEQDQGGILTAGCRVVKRDYRGERVKYPDSRLPLAKTTVDATGDAFEVFGELDDVVQQAIAVPDRISPVIAYVVHVDVEPLAAKAPLRPTESCVVFRIDIRNIRGIPTTVIAR